MQTFNDHRKENVRVYQNHRALFIKTERKSWCLTYVLFGIFCPTNKPRFARGRNQNLCREDLFRGIGKLTVQVPKRERLLLETLSLLPIQFAQRLRDRLSVFAGAGKVTGSVGYVIVPMSSCLVATVVSTSAILAACAGFSYPHFEHTWESPS